MSTELYVTPMYDMHILMSKRIYLNYNGTIYDLNFFHFLLINRSEVTSR